VIINGNEFTIEIRRGNNNANIFQVSLLLLEIYYNLYKFPSLEVPNNSHESPEHEMIIPPGPYDQTNRVPVYRLAFL
jgi:hypothetical protein